MKKIGNVLYITTPDSYLYCQNETVAVKIGGKDKVRIPAHMLDSIICFGNTTVSTPFISFCGEHGISLSFHSENGKFYGRIQGPVSGNVLLRKKQYSLSDTKESTDIVRHILSGKFLNSRNVLLKSSRDNSNEDAEKLRNAADMICEQHNALLRATEIDTMRGIEGAVANIYFSVMDCMIKTKEEDMKFVKRSKHPPENRFNAMLSFAYMLLKNDIQSALEAVGLDPAMGYLHTLRPGRPSLALDLMEELRAPLCDRMILSLVNLHQIKSDDFSTDGGEYRLKDDARRVLIDRWQNRKKEEITHPFLKEKITIAHIPYCQAMLFARYLRGDIDSYPPFVWR